MPLCHLVEACFQRFHFQTSAPWDRPRNIVGSISRYQLIEKPESLLGVGCGKNKDFLLLHGIVFCWLVSHGAMPLPDTLSICFLPPWIRILTAFSAPSSDKVNDTAKP